MSTFLRNVPLQDISIRSGGDGRTVEAFTAVFDVESEITDQQGHYIESNDPTSFNKTIADNRRNFGVLYNHGMTVHGTPSDMFSIPLGTPVEPPRPERMTVDGNVLHGLLTVTRYDEGDLQDTVLRGIKSGSIKGYSYSGRFVRSTPARPPRGGFRADATGNLTKVRRMEIAMREYGPTPFPAFKDAAIFGVRSMIVERFAHLDDEETQRLLDLATSLDGEPAGRSDTEAEAPAVAEPIAEEPQPHSGRSLQQRIRAARITRGITQ